MMRFFPETFAAAQDSYKLEAELSFEVVKQAKILPEQASCEWGKFYAQLHTTGFVLDADNRYVLSSSNHRTNLGSRSEKVVPVAGDYTVRKKGIYLGCIISHYGHFILEGLNRFYFLMNSGRYQDYDLVYHTYKNEEVALLRQFLTWLGISEKRLVCLDKTTMYEELIVPDVSTEIGKFWTDDYKNVINALIEHIAPIYNDKLYLSRLKFEDALIGEKAIADIFKQNGYKIIYPEKLPWEKQIALIKGARHLACISGTTAHNFIFAQDNAICCILERGAYANKTQFVVNHMRNLEVCHVKAGYGFLPVNYGYGPFLIGVTRFVCDYFETYGFTYDVCQTVLYKRFFYSYLKYWNMVYSAENGWSLLHFTYKDLEPECFRRLLKKVAYKLDVCVSKRCYSDKKINLNVYRAKLLMYKVLVKITFGRVREKCIIQKKAYKHRLFLCKKLLGM